MIFGEVNVENFMSIGAMKFNLNNKGLVLVQGENLDDTSQDSNGSGKSSLLDALMWCLKNVTARGETGDDIVNNVAKKNALVSVELIDDTGAAHRIQRTRKHKELKNSLTVHRKEPGSEEWVDISKGTPKLTQELVNEIVGKSDELFASAVCLSQGKMPNLPALDDKTLKGLIEEAAQITAIQRAFEIAKDKAKEAHKAFDALLAQSKAAEDLYARLTAQEESMQSQFDSWESERPKRVAATAETLKKAKATVDDLKAKIAAIDVAAIDSEMEEIDAKLKAVEKSDGEKELDAAIAKARDKLTTCTSVVTRLHGEAKAARAAADNPLALVGTPCGECGKVYAKEDVAETVKLNEAKYKELTKLLTAAVQDVKAAKEEHQELVAKKASLEKGRPDLSALVARKSELAVQRSKVKSLKDEAKRLVETALQLRDDVVRVKAEANPFAEALKKATADKIEAQKRVEELDGELEAQGVETRLCDEAASVLSPAGVRAHILDTVTPYLNARTAHYLSILSDGNIRAEWSTITILKSSEAREKFSIAVESAVGSKSYKGLSGGEQRKVRLACAMALQDLVASRGNNPLNLFIADEIDDSLDRSGLERLMTLLDEKARERGTVLVISHNSLSDWIRQSVTVVKKDGVASLRGKALE